MKVMASAPAEFDAAFRILNTDFLKFTHANAAEVIAGQPFFLEIFKREVSRTHGVSFQRRLLHASVYRNSLALGDSVKVASGRCTQSAPHVILDRAAVHGRVCSCTGTTAGRRMVAPDSASEVRSCVDLRRQESQTLRSKQTRQQLSRAGAMDSGRAATCSIFARS